MTQPRPPRISQPSLMLRPQPDAYAVLPGYEQCQVWRAVRWGPGECPQQSITTDCSLFFHTPDCVLDPESGG